MGHENAAGFWPTKQLAQSFPFTALHKSQLCNTST